MKTDTERRAELAAAIDKAILRGLVIYRPGGTRVIQSGLELLAIEGENYGYYFPGLERKEVQNN